MQYGRGWIPDSPTAPRSGGRLPALGDVSSTTNLALLDHVTEIWNQRTTSACVAFAAKRAISILAKSRGFVVTDPSELDIYVKGRVKGGQLLYYLNDGGTIPSFAVSATHEWGICAEEDWPFDPANVNHPLPWELVEKSSAYKVDGWVKLDGDLQGMKAAIDSGYPIIFGMPVDRTYESYYGEVWPGLRGPSLGGHMQCAVGFDDSRSAFRVVNSWGPEWGDGGMSWISYDWMTSGAVDDRYALESTPVFT